MALDRVIARFHNDNEQAQRSARTNLKIVMSNIHLLKKRDQEAAKSMNIRKEQFTRPQMNYIESMYEKLFAANSFQSCKTKSRFNLLKNF